MLRNTKRAGLACAAWLALVAGAHAAPPLTAAPALEHCVEEFVFPLAPAGGKSKAALAAQDIGNVTVIELSGDYSRGNTQPRVDVAQRFYADHADAYDFLVVFSTFEFATGDALAFYQGIRNDVDGIGRARFDLTSQFGSAGRLQGYIDMAATSRYDFNTRNRAFVTPLGTLAHELMHRWGVQVSYRDGGLDSTALLGRDGAHWSLLADTQASVMYGADWEQTEPGQFRIVDARQRFSPWDLYLAGLADVAEVPPLQLIRGSALDPSDLPIVGTRTTGTQASIGIEQVIAVHGARVPPAAQSQRDFTAAIVLLTRPGETADPALLVQLERFRVAFESYFQAITDGRASIAIGNFGQHTDAPIQPPMPFTGSIAPPPATPLASAVAWLKTRQQADGRWQDRPGTAARDTALAIAAVAQVEPDYPGLANARAWLAGRTLHTTDAAAWRVFGSDSANPADIALLTPTGDGLGLRAGWQPATLDTALALRSDAERSVLDDTASLRLGNFLVSTQHGDGSFPTAVIGPASIRTSAYAARALLRSDTPAHAAAGDAARDWLVQTFDAAPQNASIGDAAELLHQAGTLELPPILRADLLAGLLARQGNGGDWAGSVYTTALSTLAIALQSQANYNLGAAIAVPDAPVLGEPVSLRVRVRNSGGQTAPATTLQWFRDAGPGEGGTPIGAAFAVPSLLAGEILNATVPVESADIGASTTLVAAIDLSDAVVEASEDDNRASLAIAVSPRADGVDAALYASDMTLSPASFTGLGQTITVAGRLRNLGTNAASVPLVLYRVQDGARSVLVQTTVALPAAANAAFSLQFDIAQLGAHRLELVADPDNTVAETNDANNTLALTLPFGDAVDLAITSADIVVDPAQPAFGDDVRLRATVRNDGTRASAATQLVLERDNAGSWERLQSLPLSVPAASGVQREFTWRPERAGTHVLRIVVDPDNIVAELDESNNTASVTLDLASGDEANLIVTPGSMQFDPTPPREGRAFAVTATLRNIGLNAAPAFNAGLYLGDPRVDGVRLAVVRVPGLAGNTDTTVALDVSDFPVSGDVSLFIFADSDLEIAERSEADNLGIREAIALKLADLTLSPGNVVLEPSSPVLGAPLHASVQISNIGEQPSEPALVRLYERAGQERTEVAPAATLPALAPGAVHVLTWDWTFGSIGASDALQVSVDPDNVQREHDETNNDVTVLLSTQSGDYFVSEPFFSPNGDGVRDRTTAFFLLPPGDITEVTVRDALERPIADLTAGIQRDSDRISAMWDGRDADGAVPPDGRYRILAQRADGNAAASVDVVLDINRPVALEAVNTDRAVLRNLPPSANPWLRAPEGSAADEYVFAIGSDANVSDATRRGVFRSHVLMGGLELALSRRWLDRYAATNALDRIDVEHLALGPVQGRLLMLLRETPLAGEPRLALWTQDALAVDTPLRVVELPSDLGAADILGAFDSERVLVGQAESGSTRQVIDLVTASIAPLRQDEQYESVMHVYPQGVVLGNRGESPFVRPTRFIPSDNGLPVVDLDIDAYEYDCMVRTQFQPDAPRLLVHVQRYGEEHVDLVELRSGESRRLASGYPRGSQCGGQYDDEGGGGETRPADTAAAKNGAQDGGRDLTIFRAFWLERQNQVWVLDHRHDAMQRFTANGDALQAVDIPAIEREAEYAPFGNFTDPFVFDAEIVQPSFLCPEPIVAPWRVLAANDSFERATYDPAGRQFFLARGDVVRGGDPYYGSAEYCEGATDFQRIGIDGTATRVAGATRWPLASAADRQRYPLAQVQGGSVLTPESWPSFIHRNGTLLRRDGRVQFAAGTLTRPWNQAARLQQAWPDETRLQLANPANPAQFNSVFSTLDRMSAVLRASSDGRGVRLSGIATDGNFQHFAIDYALAAEPDTWLALIPATREEVQFDDFMTWAPPAAGAYVFRLTVTDRAGNSVQRYASAEVQFGSPIINLRQDARAISPNGDGVQDALGLTFTVARATEQRFRVIDEAARVVFEQNRVYGTPELGAQAWIWDGRDSQGFLAPDGRYRVELSAGFQLSVLLDTKAPTLDGSISPTYIPEAYGIDYCSDDFYGTRRSVSMSARAERRRVGDANWSTWQEVGRCNPASPQRGTLQLTRADALRFQYRLVAEDTAGNRTILEFAPPQDVFALLSADGGTLAPASWQAAPFVSDMAADIPVHMSRSAPPYPNVPTVLYPGPGVRVFFTSQRVDFDDEVQVDLAVVTDGQTSALVWQTIAAAVPVLDKEHVFFVPVDLTLYHLKHVALRVRSRHGADPLLISNAFRFEVGGVLMECVNSERIAAVNAKLLTPQSNPQLSVPLGGAGAPHVLLTPILGPVGTVLPGRYQFRIPPQTQMGTSATFSVADARNRVLHRDFPLTSCGGDGGSQDGSGASILIAPVVAETCDVTPTQQIHALVRTSLASGQYRITLSDPRQPQPTVLAEGSIAELPPTGFVFSTEAVPEGDTRLNLDYADATGVWKSTGTTFPVDHTPPQVQLFEPTPGARICPDASGGLSIVGEAFTDTRLEYQVEVAGGTQAPLAYATLDCSYEDQAGLGGGKRRCKVDTLETIDSPHDDAPTYRELARLQRDPALDDGPITLRLRASDWSGAQMCTTASVEIDFNARMEERSPPEPRVEGVANPQHVAVSTNAAATLRVARWFLLARETLQVTGDIYRAEILDGRAHIVEDPLTQFYSANVTGAFDPQWNAVGSGYEDGVYGAVFTATDACGNTREITRFFTIDSTPPAFNVSRPNANDALRVATVEVFGTLKDTHLDAYDISIGAGANGPWVQVADGVANVLTPRVLAQWQTLGETGPRWLRLQSMDRLGNAVEEIRPFTLLERPAVMDGARTLPPLFSPNADGVLDESNIEIVLRRAALLNIRVLADNGSVLASIASGLAAQPGVVRVPWDGHGGASVVPDGDYRVEIVAQDAEIPGNLDELELTVTIDNTAPALSGVSPGDGGFATCTDVAAFAVDDVNLQEYDATLATAAGTVIASAAGRVASDVTVASLEGLAETDYRLTLRALDAAGNRSEVVRDFTLDCTAPDVAIAAPEYAAVVARAPGRSTDITGRVQDAHLASYRIVALHDGDAQQSTLVAEGTQAVVDALLHRWEPQVPDGIYALQLTAIDRAGNSSDTATFVFVDGTPPVADIQSPDDGAQVNFLSLYGTASDDNFDEYRIDVASPADAAAGNWSTAFVGEQSVLTSDLAEFELAQQGPMRVRLVVKDRAGFESSDEIGVVVDSEPPPAPIALTAQVEGGINVRLAWQGGDAPDLAGFIAVREDVAVNQTPTAAHTLLDLDVPEGTWHYRVYALDHAGNVSEPSNIASARVDRTPPDVAILQPGNGERVRGALDILGTAASDDFDEYELHLIDIAGGVDTLLRRANTPVRNGVLQRLDTRTQPEGAALRLRLVGRDRSGNSAQDAVDFTVDNLPPAAPTGLVAALQTPDVAVHWDPNVEPDLLGYLLYRNGSLVDFGGSLPADLRPLAIPQNTYLDQNPPDGEIVYRVYAIDQAGNVSLPSAPATVTRDEDAPHVEITRPQDGLVFESAIEVAADSPERDIAQVRFAVRAAGVATWTDLGIASERPWRSTFDPDGLDYGDFELTAVATDTGGRVDPAPQIVTVEYADLTPPAAPLGLLARADGAQVTATWAANSEDDLAGYHVERLDASGAWQRLTPASIATTTFVDGDRPLGAHVYRVLAVDTSENVSPASAESTAHVFMPTFEPEPLSPTAASDVALAGIGGTRAGNAQLQLVSTAGTRAFTPGTVPAFDPFVLAPVALDVGGNDAALRVLDAEGNRSIAAATRVTRGLVPAAPSGLTGNVVGLDVNLAWTAPGGDIAGYRVYRNGVAIAADVALAQAIDASSNGNAVPEVLDADSATAWRERAGTLDDRLGATLELAWSAPALIGTLQLQWTDAAHSARAFDIEGWFDGHWNTVAQVRDHAGAERIVRLDNAYPTNRLRLRPLRAQGYGAEHALAAITVLQRTLVTGTTATDAPMDGRHVYTVRAVSTLGFEGAPSLPWTAQVGDADAPDAVVLTGSLDGRDALLDWTASAAPDLSHYALLRDGVAVAQVAAGAPRAYRDASLPNGTHSYVVHAIDAVGNQSAASNVVQLTLTGDVPGKPTITRVLSLSGQPALQVEWIAPASGSTPVAYRLFHSHAADGAGDPYRELARVPGLSHVHTGLNYGERVFYRVQAEDGSGNVGPLSDPVSGEVRNVSTPAAPRLTAPTVPGVSVHVETATFDVCGIADAGTTVTLANNGSAAGTAVVAAAIDRVRSYSGQQYFEWAALTPDGRALLRTQSFAGQFQSLDSLADVTTGTQFYGGWRYLQHNAAGDQLFGLTWYGDIESWRVGDNYANYVYTDVTSVSRFAISPDQRYVLATGYRNGALGLYLADRYGTPTFAFAMNDAYNVTGLAFTPDGTHAYVQRQDGALLRIDTATRTITTLLQGAMLRGEIGVAATSGTLLYLRDDGANVAAYVQPGNAAARLLAQRSDILGAAWAPDASQVALLLADRIELLDASTGALVRSIALNAVLDSRFVLRWSEAWHLLAFAPQSSEPSYVIDVAGRFCVRTVPATSSTNIIDAVSERSSGVRSQRSLPIEVTASVSQGVRPDLSVSSDDIRFLPSAGEPGREYSAVVTVRNRAYEAENAHGRALLVAPDGAVTTLASFNDLGYFSYGQARPFTVRLGTLTQAGEYRLQVQVDPDDTLEETDELNNLALGTLRLAVANSAALTVAADAAVAAPGVAFAGDLGVTGSTGFRGSVRLRVFDAAGAPVADVLQDAVGPLAFGTAWARRWSWQPAAGTLAGDYTLEAQLSDAAGAPMQLVNVALRIEARSDIRLHLQPARTSAVIGDSIPVQFGLDYPSGNQVISGGALRVSAIDAAGTVTPLWQGPTGTLLAGYVVRRNVPWATLGSAAGSARLRLEFTAPGIAQQIEREVALSVAPPAIALGGSLSVAPAARLVLGGDGQLLRYRVDNTGGVALADVELRVGVRIEGASDVLLSAEQHGPLALGAALQGELALDTLPQRPQAYLATLEARPAGGDWTLLSQLGLASVDAIAPEIVFLSPDAARPHRAPALLASDIVDRHSRVATARYRIDGSEWRNLLAQGNRYEAPLAGLADGTHGIVISAIDTWGNERVSDPYDVVIDNTPPLIDIVGVSEGQVSNTALVPVVTAFDLHPDRFSIWLDDQPFLSGTPVVLDGAHRLTVLAIDAAGNRADASLAFLLDTTAPLVAIVDPLDGATVPDANVPARVQTEALAQVTLGTGGWSAQAQADATGVALFASVPLALGANTLQATARDAAGNVSAPAQITVTRSSAAGELGGSIVPATASLARGLALDASMTLDNDTAAGFAALPLRVRAIGAGGQTLDTWTDTVAIAQGATLARTLSFATATWPLGAVSLEFAATLDGAWQVLDSANVAIVDAQPPVLVPLAPAANALLRSPVQLAASATDDAGVASVTYRIDAGAWTPLVALGAGSDEWRADIALDDAAYTVQFRAGDAAGNSTEAASIAFVVDNTPPQIVVAGVADGGLYGVSVQAFVTVLDAHPQTLTLTLDGAPYSAGANIGDGVHSLHAEAVDSVGLSSERTLAFEVDLDPSIVSIVVPADNAVLTAPTTPVSGLTRPFATVSIVGAASSHTATADADGIYGIDALDLVDGENTIRATATDRLGRVSPQATVTVFRSSSALGVSGTLGTTPATLSAGAALTLDYAISEDSGIARNALPVRVRVHRTASATALFEQAFDVNLAASGTVANTLQAASSGWAPGAHMAELDVQLDGTWQHLATSNFSVVDGDAPQLVFVTPPAGSYHATQATVSLDASDALGSVAAVELRVGNGGWVSLVRESQAGNSSRWSGLATAPGDGAATLQARAFDDAGNVSAPVQRNVIFDATPPLITIAGVIDGELRNAAVTPQITVQDASPFVTTTLLDGVAYVSGTPVAADGAHVLSVHSVDAAGNSAQRSIAFGIDTTPPLVTIAAPADGSVLRSLQVDVLGSSEADVAIELVVGAVTRPMRTDALGGFIAPRMALALGSNRIAARATDRAGNVGPWREIHVERRGDGALRGTLVAPTAVEQGTRFRLDASVLNETDEAMALAPARIVATLANGRSVTLDTRNIALPARGTQAWTLDVDARTWPAGHVALRLYANVDGDLQLASASMEVVGGEVEPPLVLPPTMIPALDAVGLLLLALLLAAAAAAASRRVRAETRR